MLTIWELKHMFRPREGRLKTPSEPGAALLSITMDAGVGRQHCRLGKCLLDTMKEGICGGTGELTLRLPESNLIGPNLIARGPQTILYMKTPSFYLLFHFTFRFPYDRNARTSHTVGVCVR